MNPRSKRTKRQELASRLELARLQRLRDESNLENAREHARLAKRRRKEAKLAFRRARKEVKRAKIELLKTEALIAETETRLAKATEVQTKKQPEPEKISNAQGKPAKPGPHRCEVAVHPRKKRVEPKTQPAPIAPGADIVPPKVPAPEPEMQEASLSAR